VISGEHLPSRSHISATMSHQASWPPTLYSERASSHCIELKGSMDITCFFSSIWQNLRRVRTLQYDYTIITLLKQIAAMESLMYLPCSCGQCIAFKDVRRCYYCTDQVFKEGTGCIAKSYTHPKQELSESKFAMQLWAVHGL